jgi:hypothetical protein
MGGERIVTLTGRTHRLHQKQRENVLVSIVLLKASVAEQSITNFNGDGGEHSQPEKRHVEGQKW